VINLFGNCDLMLLTFSIPKLPNGNLIFLLFMESIVCLVVFSLFSTSRVYFSFCYIVGQSRGTAFTLLGFLFSTIDSLAS